VLVTGADVSSFCKLCGECIAVCPEHLFKEGKFEESWVEDTEEARA
jgi:ferredoxin